VEKTGGEEGEGERRRQVIDWTRPGRLPFKKLLTAARKVLVAYEAWTKVRGVECVEFDRMIFALTDLASVAGFKWADDKEGTKDATH
jgi:hypothetical protein